VIVLDTTILVYAKGEGHPLRAACRSVLAAIDRGDLIATTTAEVIQEFVHVRARRRDRADAAALGRDYVDLLAPLLPVTEEHVRGGLALFARLPEIGSFDAVLAAAAIAAGAEALVSADRGFSSIRELVHIDPGTSAIDALIGSPPAAT
jgi:predicted nucleic acid-binding protein